MRIIKVQGLILCQQSLNRRRDSCVLSLIIENLDIRSLFNQARVFQEIRFYVTHHPLPTFSQGFNTADETTSLDPQDGALTPNLPTRRQWQLEPDRQI